jgi:protoporphyrinogen oxidase
VSDLAKLSFARREEVVDTCVLRTLYAYPVYDLEYRSKVTTLYEFVNRHAGLHIIGRGGTFRYNNADHSVEMGQLLAKRMLGENTDHMSVNTEQEYHEEVRQTLASVRAPVSVPG